MLKELIELVNELVIIKVEFVSIYDGINTSTAIGKLIFHLLESFAEFERNNISERTRTGLTSASTRERIKENRKGISAAEQKKSKCKRTIQWTKIKCREKFAKYLKLQTKLLYINI